MDAEKWYDVLMGAGIDATAAVKYAKSFADESVALDTLEMMDRSVLKELGVDSLGHQLAVLKLAKPKSKR